MLSFKGYMNEAKNTRLSVIEERPNDWAIIRVSSKGVGMGTVRGGFRTAEAAIRAAKKIGQKTGESVATGLKERNEFRLGDARPKTSDSWIEVDGLSKLGDVWVVDRVFPRKDEADRVAGPFRKKRQAVKKAREIVRETGEKLFFDPDGPDGPLPPRRIGG